VNSRNSETFQLKPEKSEIITKENAKKTGRLRAKSPQEKGKKKHKKKQRKMQKKENSEIIEDIQRRSSTE